MSNKTQVIKDLKNTNDTLRFIVPLLNSYGLTDNDIIIEGLQGTFIKDLNNPELDTHLLIKYKPMKSDSYAKIDSRMSLLEAFRGDYDVDDSIVYIIEIYPTFDKAINLIMEGKYSQLDNNYKRLITNFWGLSDDRTDPLSAVLWKTEAGEELFKQFPDKLQKLSANNEFWPIPNIGNESL